MKQKFIGIIVPIYKVEKYIAECIESILAQTYTNFRLILVDDGTPDSAGKICDEYAKKDQRITVIHQKNAGVTRARARGVEEAVDCEFITFVDGDDTISQNALEIMVRNCDDETSIVMSLSDNEFTPSNKNVSTDEFTKMLLIDKSMCVAIWGKLYKKSLLSDYVFKIPRHIKMSEDLIINLRIAYSGNPKIKAIKDKIYNYRNNMEGVSKTFKTTPEYEHDLTLLKLSSIPASIRMNYIKYTIESRLLGWRNIWGYRYDCRDMPQTPFYTTLKKDIDDCRYHLKPIDNILFNCTNPIVRFFVINYKRLITKLKNIYYQNKFENE